MRTSDWKFTAANMAKLYVGIAFISVSKCISQVGIYGALIGFTYVLCTNLYCVYILIKARNRFKGEKIVDICDLSAKLYGEESRKYMSATLIITNISFLMCYEVYFGT